MAKKKNNPPKKVTKTAHKIAKVTSINIETKLPYEDQFINHQNKTDVTTT